MNCIIFRMYSKIAKTECRRLKKQVFCTCSLLDVFHLLAAHVLQLAYLSLQYYRQFKGPVSKNWNIFLSCKCSQPLYLSLSNMYVCKNVRISGYRTVHFYKLLILFGGGGGGRCLSMCSTLKLGLIDLQSAPLPEIWNRDLHSTFRKVGALTTTQHPILWICMPDPRPSLLCTCRTVFVVWKMVPLSSNPLIYLFSSWA